MDEKNCMWAFGPSSPGNEKGPNDLVDLTFKGNKNHSLIRETIQNSMDAVDDTTKPVEVFFDHREFEGMELKNFFKLKEHIIGCLNKYDNKVAHNKFEPMLDFFKDSRLDQRMGYLRIVDRNTTGMHYDKNVATSPFNAFISEGTATKSNGAGGSFGFGKGVFWMYSPINTVFVSTKTDNEVNFAGLAKLCTHYIEKGHDLLPNGFYSTNGDGNVIINEDKIPDSFIPKEKGTYVFVLGASSIDENTREELICSVCRNFWMAIYRNKVVVNIDGVVIDSGSLSEIMQNNFDVVCNYKAEVFLYNPYYFYNIVTKAEEKINNYMFYDGNIDIDGNSCKAKLYIHRNNDAKGQFIFMRSPLMTVYIEKISGCKGYDGVFVCEDDFGNQFLREMEDCSHDSWTKENYTARGHKKTQIASVVLKNIKQFIVNFVKLDLNNSLDDVEQISGLEEILTIKTPTGQNDNSKKDEIISFSNLLLKDKHKENKKKANYPKPSIVRPRKTKATFDTNGRLLSNSGGKRKHRPIIPGPIKPGNLLNKFDEDNDGKTGIYATPVDVSYRTWCEFDDNKKLWHIIRIFSDKDIERAIVQVFGIDEDGKSIGLNIEETNGYEVRVGESFVDNTDFNEDDLNSESSTKQVKNAIGNVNIKRNIPLTIKLRFNSNIRYSLRINTDKIDIYENK